MIVLDASGLLAALDADQRHHQLGEVARGAYDLVGFGAAEVAAAAELLGRYGGLRLGLADASVVIIAGAAKTTRLLTLDERHFRSVRPLWGKAFTLLPADHT